VGGLFGGGTRHPYFIARAKILTSHRGKGLNDVLVGGNKPSGPLEELRTKVVADRAIAWEDLMEGWKGRLVKPGFVLERHQGPICWEGAKKEGKPCGG